MAKDWRQLPDMEPIAAAPTKPKKDWRDLPDLPVAEEPGYVESALRGAGQGITFGFQDEIAGALESAFTDKTYEQARDESRENNRKAQEANPLTYGAGEIAGALAPVLIPGAGAASLGRVALRAGLEGAAYGLGSSEADLTKGEVGHALADTALGATLGAGAGAAGHGISKGLAAAKSKVGNYLNKKGSQAADDLLARETAAEEKRIASKVGEYRSSVQSASRDLEVLQREADALPDGDLKTSINNLLNSENGLALRSQVAGNKLETAPERIAEMTGKKAEMQSMVAGKADSIASNVAEAQKDIIKKHVKPRVFTLGHRFLPPAIAAAGGIVGGPVGAVAGGAIGSAMSLTQGHPGRIIKNLIDKPEVRLKTVQELQKVLAKTPDFGGKWLPVLMSAATRGDHSFAVAHKLLFDRDPSYRQMLKDAEEGNDE